MSEAFSMDISSPLTSGEGLCSEESVLGINSTNRELVEDQLVALLETEQSYRIRSVPCRAGPGHSRVPLEEWRRKICQWAFRVIDHFRLDREVVSVGMNIFDRFLAIHDPQEGLENSNDMQPHCMCPSCKRSFDSRTYQLAAMTAIFLAAKIDSDGVPSPTSSRRQFKLKSFVELSRGQFNAGDINRMEHKLLGTLRWKVFVPTPGTFTPHLLSLVPGRGAMPTTSQVHYNLVMHVLQELARYLTELATCLGEKCSSHPPSRVSFAAILVSMDLLTLQAIPLRIRDTFRQNVLEVCGMSSHHSYGPIPHLKGVMQTALWPEMLLEGSANEPSADSGHPISIAKHYGLLDLKRIYQARQDSGTSSSVHVTPPGSPSLRSQRQSTLEGSPVSVAR